MTRFFEQAEKNFCNRFYPRLEWPDRLAAGLFFAACIVILAVSIKLSPWGLIPAPFIISVIWGQAWRAFRRYRQWQADKRRYLHARHIRRQRTETWQYQ